MSETKLYYEHAGITLSRSPPRRRGGVMKIMLDSGLADLLMYLT
jgi:hypothetical protein